MTGFVKDGEFFYVTRGVPTRYRGCVTEVTYNTESLALIYDI
jgi:hypothetical protein